MSEIHIDALLPAEMATRAEYLGVRKAEMPALKMFTLAIMAGAFISLGAIFATTVSAGGVAITAPDGTTSLSTGLPYGVTRLLAGFVFCLGLILVVVGGAELFTGNNLIVMAWASRKVTSYALLRNWVIVYAGNLIGALGTAVLMLWSRQYTFGSNSIGLSAFKIAAGKCSLEFWQAMVLGILCNALVCLAVWLTYSARSTMDKIAAIIFPVTAFVAAGFEHSIANMYFVPYVLLIQTFDPSYVASISDKMPGMYNLNWPNFITNNLIPVTIGNVIGGAVLVAAVYWSVFLRNKDK
ncbi:MAG TPA: formate/nitrite family transporter [bacterium]|nr:formate/nitrite family transporter [bacterium]HNH33646.1 formate/nitrite family transporter [bacterium]